MTDIEFAGLNELLQAIKEKTDMEAVRTVVKKNGAALQTQMVRNADFKMGYQTGTTRRSITLTFTDNMYTAMVYPTTYYSPYLEWGTRYMGAQPFVGPAFNHQKILFLNDLQKLMG